MPFGAGFLSLQHLRLLPGSLRSVFSCCPFPGSFLYPRGFFLLVSQLTSLRGYGDRCLLSLLEATDQSLF